MLTKGAIGNLINRYRAVLSKCNLMNTFGSLAVASMLVLGGAGVAGAVELGDEKTYREPVSGSEFIGNNKTVLTIIGQADKPGTNPTFNASNNDILIKDINKLIFEAGWGDGKGTQGSNATVVYNNKTISLKNIKEITNNGSIASHNYFFHAFGGKYEFTDIGKINIQSGGPVFLASGTSTADSTISVKADEINIKSLAAAVQAQKQQADSDYTPSITLNAKNITLESGTDKACVTVFNPYNPSRGYISITATETLSITGSSAVNAQYGNSSGYAEVALAAKNIIIKNNGSANTDWPYAISARNYGKITVTPTESANLTGDIRSLANSVVNVDLGTKGSLTGSVSTDDTSTTNIDFGTNSTWTVTGNSSLSKLEGTANIIVDGDYTVSIATNSTTATTVSGSGVANDALGGNLEALKDNITVDGGTQLADTDFTGMEEGLIQGAIEVDASGNAKPQKANTVVEAIKKGTSNASLALNRALKNDVRKRMGDLRYANGEFGTWARYDGGHMKGDGGFTYDLNTLQFGFDTNVGNSKNIYVGAAFSYSNGDMDFARGKAEAETCTLAAYGVWFGEMGQYADVIARIGHSDTEMDVMTNNGTINGDINNNTFGISGEFGWRFDICKSFFLEPQVELAYTYVTGDKFNMSYATYDQKAVDSLVGRAGLVAGWNLPDDRGNVYVRASVLQEFCGDAEMRMSAFDSHTVSKTDGDDTWMEYGIGGQFKVTDSTYIWADVERTEGAELEEEWRGTIGFRVSF